MNLKIFFSSIKNKISRSAVFYDNELLSCIFTYRTFLLNTMCFDKELIPGFQVRQINTKYLEPKNPYQAEYDHNFILAI